MEQSAELNFLHALLNSFKEPVLFANTDHVICYLNKAAKDFYPDGDILLGRSLLDCHNPASQNRMKEILQQMTQGLDEVLISDNEKRRLYMRAVRNQVGELIGYYERFEPPRGK